MEYIPKSSAALAEYLFFYDYETKGKERIVEDTEGKKTFVLAEHVPYAYSIVGVNSKGELLERISYEGEDAGDQFIMDILRLEQKYQAILDNKVPIKSDPTWEKYLYKAKVCCFCDKSLGADRVQGQYCIRVVL